MILDSNTHQRLNIRIVKLFDLLLLTAVFALTWGLYYADKMTYPFYNLGDYMMVGLFFIINYLITRLYRGYAIHLFRISDLVYSQALAVFITDGLLYIVMTMVNRHFMNPLPLIGAFVVQNLIIVAWSIAGISIPIRRCRQYWYAMNIA